eukprot:588698-Pyramimonas_sp.AAC.1
MEEPAEQELPTIKAKRKTWNDIAEFADAVNRVAAADVETWENGPELSEKVLVSLAMLPPEATPPYKLNTNQKNYRVDLGNGGKVEVQLYHRLFRVIELANDRDLQSCSRLNFTWLSFDSVAEAWSAIVSTVEGCDSS